MDIKKSKALMDEIAALDKFAQVIRDTKVGLTNIKNTGVYTEDDSYVTAVGISGSSQYSQENVKSKRFQLRVLEMTEEYIDVLTDELQDELEKK